MEKRYTEIVVGDMIDYCSATLKVVSNTIVEGVHNIKCEVVNKAGINSKWFNTDNTYTLKGSKLMQETILR